MAASALGSGPPKMLQSERGRRPGWAGKKGPGLGRDTTKWTGPVTHSVPPWLRNHGALNQTPSGQFSCACEGEKDRSLLKVGRMTLFSGSGMSLVRTGAGLQVWGHLQWQREEYSGSRRGSKQGGALSGGGEMGEGPSHMASRQDAPFDWAQMSHGPSCLRLLSNPRRGLVPCWHCPD